MFIIVVFVFRYSILNTLLAIPSKLSQNQETYNGNKKIRTPK